MTQVTFPERWVVGLHSRGLWLYNIFSSLLAKKLDFQNLSLCSKCLKPISWISFKLSNYDYNFRLSSGYFHNRTTASSRPYGLTSHQMQQQYCSGTTPPTTTTTVLYLYFEQSRLACSVSWLRMWHESSFFNICGHVFSQYFE